MCRLLGIVSVDTVAFDTCLLSAPRSLGSLSAAHPDGWGAAVYDHPEKEWKVEKRALRASSDESFAAIAPRMRGAVLIAHVRARTVGAVSLENTHPFRRDDWVFAHNGTIEDLDYLRRNSSSTRLEECEGDTDSELFFAYLLSRLDEARVTPRTATAEVDAVVSRAVVDIVERRIGTANFLLSNGAVLYAHRYGRSLYLVERHGTSRTVAIASEPLTDEDWLPIDDRTLLRCERGAALDVVVLHGAAPRPPISDSDIELPFTD